MSHNRWIEDSSSYTGYQVDDAIDSRFVLRSAARFDVHRGKLTQCLTSLVNVAGSDPWLAATYVSVADIANAQIRIKPLRELLSRTKDPAQFSELAAALGTLELKSVGFKKARKYFQLAAIAPNENVIAQLYWLSRNYGVHFDEELIKHNQTYEAQAQSSAEAESWSVAIEACWRWLDDEPFSARPAYQGRFIASEMLQDYASAQEFANRGLQANPGAFLITNFGSSWSLGALSKISAMPANMRPSEPSASGTMHRWRQIGSLGR